MVKRGRRRAAKTTTRRSGVRRRLSSIRKSKKTQFLGRSARNIAVGSVVYNMTTRLVGRQTSAAGAFALPLNLFLAGSAASAAGLGQKDMVSTSLKIAGSRLITTQIEPRLAGISGLSNRNGNSRSQGGY